MFTQKSLFIFVSKCYLLTIMEEKKKNTGGRPKGIAKTGGRHKGTPNITNKNFYNVLQLKLVERLPKLFEWLDKIEDPYQKINAMVKIMEFRFPKQKSVEFKLDENTGNSLEEKLYEMINKKDK